MLVKTVIVAEVSSEVDCTSIAVVALAIEQPSFFHPYRQWRNFSKIDGQENYKLKKIRYTKPGVLDMNFPSLFISISLT